MTQAFAEDGSKGDASEDVVVESRRDAPTVSEQTLDRERVLKTPGTFEDPIRLVQALPGVAVTPEYSPTAGDLAVRGGGPGENRFRLDGIEIPYLYHFNGYSSVFHSRLLESLTLYPSTFGAPFGDATGAIIDTHSTWLHPERVRGSINLNPIMGGAEIAVPIGKTLSIRASARRSFVDLGKNTSDQYTVFPRFWDYFGRVEYQPTADARWGLLAFGAGDSYARYAGEPTLLDPYEQSINPLFEYGQFFHVAALVHHHTLATAKLDGDLAYTHFDRRGTLPAASDVHVEDSLQLREDAVWLVHPAVALALGADARGESTALHVKTSQAWVDVARESPVLARGASTSNDLWRFRGGVYAEGRLTLGPVRVVPGARLDGDSLSGDLAVDPRLNARWQIASDTQLRAAGGIYSQFPRTDELDPGIGDPTLRPAHSRQAALGFNTALFGRLELGLEGYIKDTLNLTQSTPGEAPQDGVRGFAYGGEIETRYRLRDRFFASLSFSAGHSERDGQTFDYDQPWTFNAAGSWTFLPTWNVGLRVRAAAGLPYTPILDGEYVAATDTYAPILGETNSARLPTYSKIDVHVEKTFPIRWASVTLYSEVWWVPSGSNTMYLAYRYDYDDSAAIAGPSVVPLLGIRGEL